MSAKIHVEPIAPGVPALLIHGGAWDIPDDVLAEHREGLERALVIGRGRLEAGASALDCVEEVVASLEAHGAFDAGCGSVLTADGRVEMDAGLMDGATLAFGAVAGVRRLPQPIRAARVLQAGDGQVRLMIGAAAERLAEHSGISLVDPESMIHDRERRRLEALLDARRYHTSDPFRAAPRGTVGAVALDRDGRLAAATSTGGTPGRPSGRVGDSPLPGCGYYADRRAAAGATGWGEAIAAAGLTGRAVADVDRGLSPDEAVRSNLARMADRIRSVDGAPATGGLILLDANGRGAWGYSTPRMARGGWRAGSEPWVRI